MKHQYVGDINDYRKYALLRGLAAEGLNRIGVCWMLTPSDGSTDGNKLGYLSKPEQHRYFDPELFDILAHSTGEPDRRQLQTIEESGAIPGALYHNAELPQQSDQRARYMADCREMFAETDLVFFDPDNGIEVPSSRIGLKTGLKYVFLDEIEAFYAEGKSVLIYQHFPQMKVRDTVIASCVQQLRSTAPAARSGPSPRRMWCFSCWFTLKARRDWQSQRWKRTIAGKATVSLGADIWAGRRTQPNN